MIGHQTNQPRAQSDSFLAPGLLRILQQAAALRLVLMLLEDGLAIVIQSPQPVTAWPMILFTAERALLLGLLSWTPFRRQLGRWFLPAILGWLFYFPMLEMALSFLFTNRGLLFAIGRIEARDIGSPLIWLVVPMVAATWQYGYRGLRIGLGVVVIEHLLPWLLLWVGAPLFGGYIISSTARVATLALLGYVVAHMVEAQKSEHAALEQANRQLSQRAATVEQLAESRERNRMARELHDTLAHSLTGLSVQLQALGTLMEYDPQASESQLREIQASVRTGIKEMRRSIQALRATPLEELGLSEALRQLCRAQADRTGVEFAYDIADIFALNPLTEQSIYRVATEALANIERHAAATKVSVSLQIVPCKNEPQEESHKLRLEICDNGVGFDPQSVPPDRFGLKGMTERAALVGGTLNFASAPGEGTRIVLITAAN